MIRVTAWARWSVVVLAAALTVACGSDPSAGQATPTTATTSTIPAAGQRAGASDLHWLVSASAVSLLAGAGMNQAQLAAAFDSPRTYLIRAGASSDPEPGWRSALTQTFTSYAAMSGTLAASGPAQGVHAVLYDDEDWALTPAAEQHDPATYEQRAAALAHAHHLVLIAAPATDLTRVLAPGQPPYAAYLRLGIAADAARSADVIDIQAQGSETNTTEFVDFVQQAAAQARQANPNVVVLAGISTNPTGHSVTEQQLQAVVTATDTIVDGYWLNIPAASPACPSCGQPQPQVAVALLRSLTKS